jgi:hypothetical protein
VLLKKAPLPSSLLKKRKAENPKPVNCQIFIIAKLESEKISSTKFQGILKEKK